MKSLAAVCLVLVAVTTVDAHLYGGFPLFPGRFPGMIHPGIGFPHPFLPRFGPFGFPRLLGPHFGGLGHPGLGVYAEPNYGARAEPTSAEPSYAEPSVAIAEPGVGVPETFGAVPYYKK